ncbi:hypothetical protein Patl1_03240 [Pistacia atlantica]|uniref:Uncharacterized protein n=1 Tax=Pistacia atlantica TaxID=434234 RepID=A0ACC1C8S3_9ROSI|nr:hypothetical protein Patl1_03240 [Pistacia atlantica]
MMQLVAVAPNFMDVGGRTVAFGETVKMFYLSKIEHTLRLPPHLLSRPLDEAIKLELENIFLDKVVANLGLCISVYDIFKIEGGFIFPGEGASTYTVRSEDALETMWKSFFVVVEFRLVVFRPFVGEIIAAKLKESDANGLRCFILSTDFLLLLSLLQTYAKIPTQGWFRRTTLLSMNVSLGFFDDIYIPSHLLPSPSRSEPDPDKRYDVRWIWEFGDTKYLIDGIDEIKFRVLSVKYPPIPIEQPEGSKPFAPMVVTAL